MLDGQHLSVERSLLEYSEPILVETLPGRSRMAYRLPCARDRYHPMSGKRVRWHTCVTAKAKCSAGGVSCVQA